MCFWPRASVHQWLGFGLTNEEGVGPESEPLENAHWVIINTHHLVVVCSVRSHNFANYYIYETEATDSSFEDIELTKIVQNNETTWIGTVSADGANLTWVNMTVTDLASGAIVKMTNEGKLYSHPFLGVDDAEVVVDGKTVDFRCSEHCVYGESIEVEAESSK